MLKTRSFVAFVLTDGESSPEPLLRMTLQMEIEDFAGVILQSDIVDCGGIIVVCSSRIGLKRGRKT